MEEIITMGSNITRLIAMVGGVACGIALAYAGLMWMLASGDPQKMGQAKNAFLGGLIGLVIVGVAFIAPRVISEYVIEPVGGVGVTTNEGLNCDGVFQSQLVFQRSASNADRMNQLVQVIQAQRDECSSEVWDPFVNDGITGGAPGTNKCFAAAPTSSKPGATIGTTAVPRSLHLKDDYEQPVRKASGRDAANNMIVYFGEGTLTTLSRVPSNGAKCWLYVSRTSSWDEGY